MMFKGMKVYALFDDQGQMVVQNDRATLKYQLEQDQEYKVNPSNIFEIDEAQLKRKKSKKPLKAKPNDSSPNEEGVISVFTDGACEGNPGPAGAGIYFKHGKREREISRYLGQATNNIAELTAIKIALKEIKQPQLPVKLYTDSEYCHGILSLGWKSTRNLRLISEIKEEMRRFRDLRIIKIDGHSGIEENERVDKLARKAIAKKKDTQA